MKTFEEIGDKIVRNMGYICLVTLELFVINVIIFISYSIWTD